MPQDYQILYLNQIFISELKEKLKCYFYKIKIFLKYWEINFIKFVKPTMLFLKIAVKIFHFSIFKYILTLNDIERHFPIRYAGKICYI